jgi:hypothetical protein
MFDYQWYVTLMTDWMFFIVESVGMGEICMAKSNSYDDNIYFTGCAGGRLPFMYGFFFYIF